MPITEVQRNELDEAFKVSARCQGAESCIRRAQAMNIFYKLNNVMVNEEGEGLILFPQSVGEVCPSRDQLTCQDRVAAEVSEA